jgi:hypothetical protein
MEYCAPLGIQHSQFLKWPTEDQDKALAYSVFKRTTCDRCGTIPEDWLDEDGRELDDPPYKVASRYCPGCATLEAVRDEIPKNRKNLVTVFLTRAGGAGVRRKRQRRAEGG